jgi:uncharacterized protein
LRGRFGSAWLEMCMAVYVANTAVGCAGAAPPIEPLGEPRSTAKQYPAITTDLMTCYSEKDRTAEQLVSLGCVFEEELPSPATEKNVLRVRWTGSEIERIDSAEIDTNGIIVVETTNPENEPIVVRDPISCGEVHTQIVGVVEEDNVGGDCMSYPQSRALLSGRATRIKFDFRRGGGHNDFHFTQPDNNLWPLPDGCYDMRFSFGGTPLKENVRVCYRGQIEARDAAVRSRSSCAAVNSWTPPPGAKPLITEWTFDEPKEELQDANTRNTNGWTPLMWAAENGDLEFARSLLERGAQTAAWAWNHEETPLTLALRNRHYDVVDLLLQNGALPSARAVSNAARMAEPELERILIRIATTWKSFPGTEKSTPPGRSKVPVASLLARFDSVPALEALLANGGTLSYEGSSLMHPLVSAADTCSFYATEFILDHEGEFPAGVIDGALASSASKGCYFVSELLLIRGASSKTAVGHAAILGAARAGEFEIVRLMLEHGFDVNQRFPLVNSGFKLGDGCPPVWRAESVDEIWFRTDSELQKALKNDPEYLEGKRELDRITREKCGKNLAELEKELPRPKPDDIGTTLLIESVSGYSAGCETVEVLLTRGAVPTDENRLGETALDRLASSSWSDCVAGKLLEYGADVNHIDHTGKTALIKAVAGNGYRSEDAVKFLLDHGADPEIKDGSGKTALDYAHLSDDMEIRAMLPPLHGPGSPVP